MVLQNPRSTDPPENGAHWLQQLQLDPRSLEPIAPFHPVQCLLQWQQQWILHGLVLDDKSGDRESLLGLAAHTIAPRSSCGQHPSHSQYLQREVLADGYKLFYCELGVCGPPSSSCCDAFCCLCLGKCNVISCEVIIVIIPRGPNSRQSSLQQLKGLPGYLARLKFGDLNKQKQKHVNVILLVYRETEKKEVPDKVDIHLSTKATCYIRFFTTLKSLSSRWGVKEM